MRVSFLLNTDGEVFKLLTLLNLDLLGYLGKGGGRNR